MVRGLFVVCLLAAPAGADPVAITTEPAPSTTPPTPYAPPPSNAPGLAPTYSAPSPRQRSDRFMLAMGALVGGGNNWIYGAYHAELAATILREPLRLRARAFGALIGGTIESDWSGEFSRYGAGLEARWCTNDLSTCLFADLDVGYQKLTLDDGDGDFVRSDNGVIAGPRAGVDWGGAFRLRFALELYEVLADHDSATGTNQGFGAFNSLALSVALGYQL
jgi:hypothetical protein